MEKIIKEFFVYDYEELSDKAKEKAKEEFLNKWQNSVDFTDFQIAELQERYPNSDLGVNYDFGYSQGSGVNLYGNLCIDDVKGLLKLNKTETDLLNTEEFKGISIELPENRRYTYSLIDCSRILDELEDKAGISAGDLERSLGISMVSIASKIAGYLIGVEKAIYDEGIDYFYGVTDEEMIAEGEANRLRYLEDGELYF